MKRKTSLIVLLGALCGLVLAGCSNSSDTSSTPATTNAPAAPATPPATN